MSAGRDDAPAPGTELPPKEPLKELPPREARKELPPADPLATLPPQEIEGKIVSLRGELGDIVSELDRRRHEAFDVKLQFEKHRTVFILAGVALVGALGAGIASMIRERRQRERPVERARRARRAFERLMEDPEHMARESTVAEKIAAAGGTAVVSLLVKRALDQVMPAR